MPVGTAFHARTLALCESLNYREWAGYYAVSAYEPHHEHEYAAIRNGAALIDVSPLFKYIVSGPDATRLVDRVITRDATKVAVGQVIYTPWCDERGKVIDDGTVTRLDEQRWRWTAADPSLRWFRQNAAGLDAHVEDISEQVAALAVQGPTSARLLKAVADVDLDPVKYFRMTRGRIADVPVEISRTGYTGDLGYEVWMPWDRATDVWDRLVAVGKAYDAKPAGMLALDVARIEAGPAPDRRRLPRIAEGQRGPAALHARRDGPGPAGQRGQGALHRARGDSRRALEGSRSARSSVSRSRGPTSSRSTRKWA